MASEKTAEIDAILEGYHLATLLAMARAAMLPVPATGRARSAQLKGTLQAGFFTRERVLASLARIDKRERAVLNQLQLRGGSAPTDSLKREAVKAGLVTEPEADWARTGGYYQYNDVPYARGEYTGSPEREGSRVFADVVARLTYHGLVFSRFTGEAALVPTFKLKFHPAPELYIPAAVLEHLPPAEPAAAVTSEPSTVRQGEPEILLRDLYLYWDYVRRNEVPLIKAGLVSKRALRAINQQLLVPDPWLEEARSETDCARLSLLGQLLVALKLARPERGHLRPTGEASQAPEFWGLPQAAQLAACIEAWPGLRNLSELDAAVDAYEPQYPAAREALLRALKALPAGRWVEPEDLLERMQAEDADFLFAEYSRIQGSRGSWYHSYSNNQYYGPPKSLLEILDRYQARFLEACLAGFLLQTGVVEMGYEGERLAGVRLTGSGRVMLGLATEDTPVAAQEDGARVVVQPNFQILAMGPVSLVVLARLDLFADRERADRGAFAYRLSRESVYRAQQMGMGTAEIIAFLETSGGLELPQNVRRSLEEWAAHHERIIFRTGISLLQAATPDLLRGLLAGPDTAPLFARGVTPEVALVAAGAQERLVAALVQRGIFPAVSGADVQSADHSVFIDEDGTIRPVHAVPSLHLRGRLARLADESPAGDGTWRLTPASVHRAAGNKARVLRLLDELRALQRGRLPESLIEQIRAWGSYYGDAAVQTLTLIEFRDSTTLDELRERPDLRELLILFPAGDRALAAVPAERLAEVREILAGLGVRVREGL